MYRKTIISLLLAALTLAAFWPATRLGYTIFDDQDYVYQNLHVQAGLNAANVAWAFTTGDTGNWHPITWLSLMLDTQLFGLGSASHHWINVGLHIVTTILLFLVLSGMTTGTFSNQTNGTAFSVWCSGVTAALFAVHPLRVESVAWISERKDVLCAFFMMLTLWAWLCYVKKTGKPPNQYRLPGSIWYWVSVIFFALGLMSKAMIVSMPILLLLLDYWPLKRMAYRQLLPPSQTNNHLLFEKLPFYILCAVFCIITYQVQSAGGSVETLDSLSMEWRISNALWSYFMYLEKLFWPVNLAVIYPIIPELPVWKVAGIAVALTAATWLCVKQTVRRPYLAVGWLWFLIMFIPVIGLVQIGRASMADRYSYLPCIGIILAIVWMAAEWATSFHTRRIIGITLAFIVILASLAMTWRQLKFWKDDVIMFQHATEVTEKNNYYGYLYLGNALTKAGRLDEAVTNYQISIRLVPTETCHVLDAHYNMACVLAQQNKNDAAKAELEDVIQLEPNYMLAHLELGRIDAQEKDYIGAENELMTAKGLDPKNPAITSDLAIVELKANGEANLASLEDSLKVHPTAETHVKIAMLQEILERYPEALKEYEAALQMSPDSVDILNDLGWFLATCPDGAVRNGVEAVKYGEQAARLTDYRQTMIVGTLAAAYAEAGRFDNAVTTAQKACDLAKASGNLDLLQKNQQLLEKYKNKQTCLDKNNSRH